MDSFSHKTRPRFKDFLYLIIISPINHVYASYVYTVQMLRLIFEGTMPKSN